VTRASSEFRSVFLHFLQEKMSGQKKEKYMQEEEEEKKSH
jgi:hypothetical protein